MSKKEAVIYVRPKQPRTSGLDWQCQAPQRKHGVGVSVMFDIGVENCGNYSAACADCLPAEVVRISVLNPKFGSPENVSLEDVFGYLESWERTQLFGQSLPSDDPDHAKEEADLAALLTPTEKAARDGEEESKYRAGYGDRDKTTYVVRKSDGVDEFGDTVYQIVFETDSCVKAVKHLWSLHVAEEAIDGVA